MLKVRDLIEQLQALDPELPVMLQSNPEGNGFFWVSGADADGYVDQDDLESDRTEQVWSTDDLRAEFEDDDEDPFDGYTRVVTVYP